MMKLTKRGQRLARLLAAAVLAGGVAVVAVPMLARAHTSDECVTVRQQVANEELKFTAAEHAGGLTSAQRTAISTARAINAKALQHCPGGAPSPSPSATPPVSSSPSASPSATPSSSAPTTPAPSGWPDANNTGPASDVQLTNYTGPCTITTPGTLIEAKTVNCDLVINVSGVTVSKSVVNGNVKGSGSYTVVDSIVNAGGPRQESAIGDGSTGITVLRTEATGGHRGIYCDRCTITDSWIHAQVPPPGGTDWHFGGVRVESGAVLTHNSIVCDVEDNNSGGGCSSDITGYPDWGPIHDNRFENNLFKATPGGYCGHFGATSGKPFSNDPLNATNIVVLNNTFQRGSRPSQWNTFICAYWGPATDFDGSRSGNVWSGNKYDDGTAISAP